MTEGKKAIFHMFIATHQDYGFRWEFLPWRNLLTNNTLIRGSSRLCAIQIHALTHPLQFLSLYNYSIM